MYSEHHPSSASGPLLQDDDWLDMESSADLDTGDNATTAQRTTPFNSLRVLVSREGRMGQDSTCSCSGLAQYQCTECHGARMLCQECMVEGHQQRPLCRIEAWNGRFFERRELRKLGLRCRLSSLSYHWEQLLVYGWYPTTPDNPRSTVTIPMLKVFHAVSLQGKTMVYHFFNTLAKITDNTGSCAFRRRYQPILCIVRQWRNLRCLKRGGVGNDPDQCTAETREGELAVDCLACPKLGVNLPEGWKQAPPEKRFLFTIFFTIDACFRLKRKKILNWLTDPSIQDGWSYFMRSLEYMEFVKTLGEQKEMSICTGLAALDHANTKYSQGYAATGCGMITCGRHEIVCKNRVANLQAGEKYGNMDYVVASAWHHWFKNLLKHLLKLSPGLRFHLVQYMVKYVILKLHILGHLKSCQDFFSLLFTLGAAQADMEGIEQIWLSRLTLCKRFLKAMKERAKQQDGLTEFLQHQEEVDVAAWKKSVDDFESEASLVNPYELPSSGPNLKEIELELTREEQERKHRSAAMPNTSWETMTECLMLELEIESQQRQLAADMLAKRSPTPKELTEFVTWCTHLSHQVKKLCLMQCTFCPGALQNLATAVPEAVEAERIPLLLPSVLSTTKSLPPLSASGLAAAEVRLCDGQCSEVLDQICHGLSVKKRLSTYKMLNTRCQHQNTRARRLVDTQQRKVDLAAGTYRQAWAMQAALSHIAGTTDWCPLQKDDSWMPEDEEEAKRRRQCAMRGKCKEAAQVSESREVWGVPGMGEKTCLISWIWLSVGCTSGVMGEEIHASVRVEWCKAYARVKRWQEEVLLLQEEMNRCLRTLVWQARVWDGRATAAHYTGKLVYSSVHMEGAMAFAARQATMQWKLARRFDSLEDEADLWFGGNNGGGNGSDSDSDAEEEEARLEGEAVQEGDTEEGGGDEEESDKENKGDGGEDLSPEQVDVRRAWMDELLAIQFASIGQYNDA
ncbi:hypothetical protein DFH08DRAFT_798215 [Mycena albidolilacea]|uniref:CxC2-like cysteine cluster KDZ transposase-associated domain-containing protein n=1 Tax=Mycena albidolilacea TaxID=1033008 RepID=A0AAD7AMY8_9AGAR|nr:hypothetical protein DFH08DRAFT_798215 [Mycena albidolilacea]